jgi:hypothetical protein
MSSGSRKKKQVTVYLSFAILLEGDEVIDVAWETWKDEPKYKKKGKILTLNPHFLNPDDDA